MSITNGSTTLPKITGVRPTGSRILVEMLTPQESMGTALFIDDKTRVPVFQGYVKALGPQVPEGFGVEVGDRVWIDGAINYAPDYNKSDRKTGTVEYHMVKGIIEEGKIDLA